MAIQGWKMATAPEDGISNPTPGGYRDVKVALEVPDGHIAELQIHLKHMLYAKENLGGHDIYEKYRSLDEPIKARVKAGRPEASPAEQSQLSEYERQMHVTYDPAWQKVLDAEKGGFHD